MPIDDPAWPRADHWLAQRRPDPAVTVVGLPTAHASLSPSRADLAPSRMRERLSRFSTFQGEWEIDLEPVAVADLGDLDLADVDLHSMPTAVHAQLKTLPPSPLRIYLGGDNAITRPLAAAAAGGDLDRLGVLTFDAHHDVRTLDQGPTNGTPIRGLIADGLPGQNVVQVGIHSFANSLPYRRFCIEQGIGVVTVSDLETTGIEQAVADALDHLASRCDRIYIDVDLDVLDASFAPGCPGARPGGITPRQLALGARHCGRHPQVVAVDLVEVDPERDLDGRTVDAMATVFLSVVAGYAERGER